MVNLKIILFNQANYVSVFVLGTNRIAKFEGNE